MVVPDGIVEHQLIITLCPIVSDSGMLIDNQDIDANKVEPGRCRESGLSCTWKMLAGGICVGEQG